MRLWGRVANAWSVKDKRLNLYAFDNRKFWITLRPTVFLFGVSDVHGVVSICVGCLVFEYFYAGQPEKSQR